MTTSLTVTAVIPVYNRRDLLERCLASIGRQTRPFGQVVVVDNGSSDGAAEAAREWGARVIEMGANRGFACAVNRGIQEAAGEWVAVLNSDVELAPDWLERMPGETWFATGRILRAGDTTRIDGTFDALSRAGCAYRIGSNCLDGPLFREAREICMAPATAALYRTELFRRVGGFDESFESYLEDVELGLRCAIEGLTGRYVPEAVAWHHGGASLGRWHAETVRHMARNQVLIARRYGLRGWPVVVGQLLWGGVALRHGAGGAWCRGVREGMRAGVEAGPALPRRLLIEWEAEIRRVQVACGWDPYWRIYFALAGEA